MSKLGIRWRWLQAQKYGRERRSRSPILRPFGILPSPMWRSRRAFRSGPFCGIARGKQIPEAVLRSPREVMSAFLRGYFDADGYAGKPGVILSTSSKELAKTVQIVLLNYGILSRRRLQGKDIWNLEIKGASALRF